MAHSTIPGTPAHRRWPTLAALRRLHDRDDVTRVVQTTDGCADLWTLATDAPSNDPLQYVRRISGDACGGLRVALQSVPEPGWLSVLLHVDDAIHFNAALTGAIVEALADPTWSHEAQQAWMDQGACNTITSQWGTLATYHLPPSHYRRLVRDVVPWFAPMAIGTSPQAARAVQHLLDSLATTPVSDITEFHELLQSLAAVADAGAPTGSTVFCSVFHTWTTHRAVWGATGDPARSLLPFLTTLAATCGYAPPTLRHALLDADEVVRWASLVAAYRGPPTDAPQFAWEDSAQLVAADRPNPLVHPDVLAVLLTSANHLLREMALLKTPTMRPVSLPLRPTVHSR